MKIESSRQVFIEQTDEDLHLLCSCRSQKYFRLERYREHRQSFGASAERQDLSDITDLELMAFVGLQLCRGMQHLRHHNVRNLFSVCFIMSEFPCA